MGSSLLISSKYKKLRRLYECTQLRTKKIGQALMVPVAALPAAALLMGIGYWIDPDGWGANSQLAALLIKSGAAIIDNMGLLFAVGVAFGLAKDKHGSAALSGLVGFYVVTTLLSPAGVAQLQHIDISEVPAAFKKKINNQFIGILIGGFQLNFTTVSIKLNYQRHFRSLAENASSQFWFLS